MSGANPAVPFDGVHVRPRVGVFFLHDRDSSKSHKSLESLEFTVYPFMIMEAFSLENFSYILSFVDFRVMIIYLTINLAFTSIASLSIVLSLLVGINVISLGLVLMLKW